VSTVAVSPGRSRTGPLLWLVGTQLIALVSLAPWALIAGFAFVSASGGALLPGPLRYPFWAYPLLPLVCAVLAWRAYGRGEVRRAVRVSTLPLCLALPLLAYIWYMARPVG
jgi:hypothetical protein